MKLLPEGKQGQANNKKPISPSLPPFAQVTKLSCILRHLRLLRLATQLFNRSDLLFR